MNNSVMFKILPVINSLRTYHKHKVIDLQHLPHTGRILLVATHSLATYDIALLFAAIYQETGRISRPLADHLLFKLPLISDLITAIGGTEGTPQNASTLLSQEELVAVAPGGMREALRPSSERYQILWQKRLGFAKLAIETKTPIVLAVCPKADDIYDVYPNRLTAWIYRSFKIPLVVARGLGPTVIPRPVALSHFLSAPITPPKKAKRNTKQQLQIFHQDLIEQTQLLIGKAIAYRQK